MNEFILKTLVNQDYLYIRSQIVKSNIYLMAYLNISIIKITIYICKDK